MLKTDKIADIHIHLRDLSLEGDLALIKNLIDYGIEIINIASITYLAHTVDTNVRALYCKQNFAEAKVSVFGGLYYSPFMNHYEIPFLQQAQRLLDMGCDGIKLIENKPKYRKYIGFGLNSKIYDEMFDMLEEKQIPLLCHVNDPEEFWHKDQIAKLPVGQEIIENGWCYDTEDYLTYDDILGEVLERLARNPKLNIIFAHFMFLSKNIELAEELINKYPNLKFDLTPGWEMYVGFMNNYDKWREFFEKYSDRIFYGTDTTDFSTSQPIHETVRYAIGGEAKEKPIPCAPFADMKGFDLSDKAQKNICYNNFASLIGEIKPVNVALLREETEVLLKRAKSYRDDKMCIERLEQLAEKLSSM